MKSLLVSAIFAAVLGMFQFGFNTGVINSPQIYIEEFIRMSYLNRTGELFTDGTVSTLFSVAVCSCLVGGMIGGLSAAYVADRFGRRTGLWYSQALSIVGGIAMGICKVSSSYELLVIGRFIIGVACGLFTGLVPLYITEIAPVNIRGGLGTLNQLAVTFGILSSQVLGLDVVLGSENNWPILLALGAVVPAVIQVVMLPMMPESPRFTIINKQDEQTGKAALERLRDGDVTEEFDEIKSDAADAVNAEHVSVISLLTSKHLYLPLFICVTMHLSQQFSGIVAIFYYSTKFFINAGVSEESAKYATLGVGAILVTMTLVTIPLMDRLGRRTLHLGGLIGILVFSILITIALAVGSSKTEEGSWVDIFLIAATFGFVVFFALGPGSIPWLITGELFDQGPRPAAMAVATVVNWGANLVVGLSFPALQTSLDEYTFVPFTILVAIFIVLLYIYLPETKGRTTSEITHLLNRQGAWKRTYYSSHVFET